MLPGKGSPAEKECCTVDEVAEITQALPEVRVLVVDDEKNIRATLSMCLEETGCQVEAVASAGAAVDAAHRQAFDLAFVDLRLGAVNGLDLIPQLLAENPQIAVIVVTAYATVDTAVAAMKRGAADYLPKPFTPAQIRHVVEQATERRAMARRVADLEQRLKEAVPEADLESRSPHMQAVVETITRAARADAPVLLRGESGTGKGVLARALHANSLRAARPFVVVNCPTLSEELLASELFGHAKGAFTGAVRDQPGRVEAAEGGTLFLDEIGEISPALQAKLLRFLQEKQFERVGETHTRTADVRLVAATNRDLQADVRAGRFREDLLYRINVLEIELPPLRERAEDILRLAHGFVAFFTRAARRPTMELSAAAEQALLTYRWPGNIRELRNVIERAVILWPARVIEPAAFPEHIAGAAAPTPSLGGDYSLETIEREHILRVLSHTPTLEEASRILGIDSSTLWRKRKRYEQ
jgi:NtrC-family two-component system response regulator AlgB